MICHMVSIVAACLRFSVCQLSMIGHISIKTLVVGYDASVLGFPFGCLLDSAYCDRSTSSWFKLCEAIINFYFQLDLQTWEFWLFHFSFQTILALNRSTFDIVLCLLVIDDWAFCSRNTSWLLLCFSCWFSSWFAKDRACCNRSTCSWLTLCFSRCEVIMFYFALLT